MGDAAVYPLAHDCPHCEQSYTTRTYLYSHVLTKHTELVEAAWRRRHGYDPAPACSQMQFTEVARA